MDIERIAELSKIYFSPAELESMQADMTQIIALMDTLREVELPAEEDPQVRTVTLPLLRGDEPGESLDPALLLEQSPDGRDFKLPRILE